MIRKIAPVKPLITPRQSGVWARTRNSTHFKEEESLLQSYHSRKNVIDITSSAVFCRFIGFYDIRPVSKKCFVPCLLGEELQHPTCPNAKHNRRCTLSEPIFLCTSHPFVLL